MSRKMSKSLAETIARDAMREKHDAFIKRRDKERHALAMDIYEETLGAPMLKHIKAIPNGWFAMQDSIYGATRYGIHIHLFFGKGVAAPRNDDLITKAVSEKRVDEWRRAEEAYTKEEKEINALRNQIEVLCLSCSTISALRKAWPEGEKFYKRHDAVQVIGKAVVIPIAGINQALGLKSKGNAGDVSKT